MVEGGPRGGLYRWPDGESSSGKPGAFTEGLFSGSWTSRMTADLDRGESKPAAMMEPPSRPDGGNTRGCILWLLRFPGFDQGALTVA